MSSNDEFCTTTFPVNARVFGPHVIELTKLDFPFRARNSYLHDVVPPAKFTELRSLLISDYNVRVFGLGAYPSITKLVLHVDIDEPLPHMPNLKILRFHEPSVHMQQSIDNNPQLVSLRVSDNVNNVIISKPMPNLEKLTLGCKTTEYPLPELVPRLKKLVVSGCDGKHIPDYPTLTRLYLCDNHVPSIGAMPNLEDVMFINVEDLMEVHARPHVKQIYIRGELPHTLPGTWPSLRKIHHCHNDDIPSVYEGMTKNQVPESCILDECVHRSAF